MNCTSSSPPLSEPSHKTLETEAPRFPLDGRPSALVTPPPFISSYPNACNDFPTAQAYVAAGRPLMFLLRSLLGAIAVEGYAVLVVEPLAFGQLTPSD